MRVLVCDDEKLGRDRLIRLTEAMADTEVVGEAATGREAVIMAQSKRPDVVLLDIRMPDMDGLEAARHLLKLESPPAIIFCTAYDEHALEAFKVQAVDYLLKPVAKEDLGAALERVRNLSRSHLDALEQQVDPEGSRRRRHISARTHRGIELVPVDEVRYFLADQKYVTVKYPAGEVLVDDTLKELEDEFDEHFVRIHRNALVAVKWLEGMELVNAGHYQVRLNGVEERLVVSRRHVAGLRKMMARL